MSRYRKRISSDILEVRAEVTKDGILVHWETWWSGNPFSTWGGLFKRAHNWADKRIALLEKWETQPTSHGAGVSDE